MIIETMFCDNTHDTELYKKIGANGIAEMIASGITGKAVPKNRKLSQYKLLEQQRIVLDCTIRHM